MPVMEIHTIYITIGQNIRRLRLERGLSQEQLALQAQVNRGYTGAIERGERRVSVATLAKLAQALGVELSKLFEAE